MNVADIAVADLVPHAAPMVLLDRVTAVTENTLTAQVVVRGDGMFDEEALVPSLVGVEYMAQTIAAWAGYHAIQRGESIVPGLLLGARAYDASDAEFHVGETLDVDVNLVMQSVAGMAVFDCVVRNERIEVGARLTVLTRPAGKPHESKIDS